MQTSVLKGFMRVCVLVSLSMSGCGRGVSDGLEIAPVSGIVRLNGQPLPKARVEFLPTVAAKAVKKGVSSAGSVAAITDKNGKYVLRFDRDRAGAVPGQYSVRVTTAGIGGDPDKYVPEQLPPHYNLHTQLSYEVKRGKNEINLELQSNQTASR